MDSSHGETVSCKRENVLIQFVGSQILVKDGFFKRLFLIGLAHKKI